MLKKSSNYYNSIDELPLYNWMKCTDGKVQYIRKDIAIGTDEKDLLAWEIVFDDYINRHGLNETYVKVLKVMKSKAILECNFVIDNDRFALTLLELEVEKLKRLLNNNGVGMTIDQSLIHLSKWVGSWINTKSITASEYFNLVKEFERSNK